MVGRKGPKLVAAAIVIGMLVTVCGAVAFNGYKTQQDTPKALFDAGMSEYYDNNYHHASGLFMKSYYAYRNGTEPAKAWDALQWSIKADRVTLEYPFNRSQATELLIQTYPSVERATIDTWLDAPNTEKIVSDGETLYFMGIASNFQFRNLTLMHQFTASIGQNPIYDPLVPIVWGNTSTVGSYFDPQAYEVTGTLDLPRDLLPQNGTLKIWVPAPVDEMSQRNSTLVSVTPSQYLVQAPDFGSRMGIAYLEVPLDGMTQDVKVVIVYRFETYQQNFTIDPANIGTYDKASAEYQMYTASTGNTFVSPGILALAHQVVGDETNPYLQAKLIYDYIVKNYPYALMPHVSLQALGVPESVYVYENGHGDCGAQSMFFSALCRAVGIPARSCGGYQLIPGSAGTHFWAEFLLPNYGWVPVDVTVAEAADWASGVTDQNVTGFKDYYFGNLDPYRFVIQLDVDVPLAPAPGNATLRTTAHQEPAAVCLTANQDMEALVSAYWTWTLPETERRA
jgi:transglutaminase-like putative cysteine protease